MKINMKALLKVGGIQCHHVLLNEKTGEKQRLDAHLAFISEKTVKAARELERCNPAFDPDTDNANVLYGCALVVVPGSHSEYRVLAAGEAGPYVLDIDGRDFPLVGSDMLSLCDRLMAKERDLEILNMDQRNALDGIRDIFKMVASVPDPERFPDGLVSQAYRFMMFESGNVRLPVSNARFVAKSRADLYRARIGQIDSFHRDSISSARPLRDLLRKTGIKISENGIDTDIRSSIALRATEEVIRRVMQSNESMCREVFGTLTRTPIEKMSAAMISFSGLEAFRNDASNCLLSGEWINRVRGTAGTIVRGGKPNHGFGMDIYSRGGRDIMVILDQAGRDYKVAFVYSWPTAERIPAMRVDGGYVMSVSPEEIPDHGEIERLREIVENLESVNAHDTISERHHFIN